MVKILLVDTDQLHMRALRKRIAMHMEADVVCISTYKEVVDLGKHAEFSVAYVAMDVCNQKASDIIRYLYYTYPQCQVVMMVNKHIESIATLTMKYEGIGYLYKPFSWVDFNKWIPQSEREIKNVVCDEASEYLDAVYNAFLKGDFLLTVEKMYRLCQHKCENCDKNTLIDMLYSLIDEVQTNLVDYSDCVKPTFHRQQPLTYFTTRYPEGLNVWIFKTVDFLFMEMYKGKQDILYTILCYIHDHIQEDISLKDIVVACNVSQGYVSRIFKQKLNTTIMQYIHKKKINLAKEYILGTEKSGAHIANILGYSDVSYFCKIFKKHEHRTISQYRDQLING